MFEYYSSQNVLLKHKRRGEQQRLPAIKTSNESHLYWKEHFHKNTIHCSIYAHFESDNEIESSSVGEEKQI